MFLGGLYFSVYVYAKAVVSCVLVLGGLFLTSLHHLSTFSTLLIAFKKHIFLKHNEVVWLCLKKERERGGGREGGKWGGQKESQMSSTCDTHDTNN